jgi:hypothetical protein
MLDLIYLDRFDRQVRAARNEESKRDASVRAADGAAAIALAKRRQREGTKIGVTGGR